MLGGLTVVLPNAYFALGTVRRAIPDGDAERLTEARRLLGRGIGKWALRRSSWSRCSGSFRSSPSGSSER